MRHANAAAVALIKRYESLRLDAYLCATGHPTIGWGHTRGVRLGQTVTREQAEELFAEDLYGFELSVSRLVPASCTDNQFSALVSFAFNEGVSALATSRLLERLHAGDAPGAAAEFARWVYGHDTAGRAFVVPGLPERRAAEAALFLTPPESPKVA